MKKSIFYLLNGSIIACTILNACNTPSEKVKNAKEDVKVAHDDLDKAQQNYVDEMESYKKNISNRIEENNKNIRDFQSRIEKNKIETRNEYEKKITKLERKNSDLKKKVDEYKAEGKDQWEIFKTGVDRDLKEMSDEMSDLTTKKAK